MSNSDPYTLILSLLNQIIQNIDLVEDLSLREGDVAPFDINFTYKGAFLTLTPGPKDNTSLPNDTPLEKRG